MQFIQIIYTINVVRKNILLQKLLTFAVCVWDVLQLEEVKTLVLILTLEQDGSFVEDGDFQTLEIMCGSQLVETRLPNETPLVLALSMLDEMKEAIQE